MKLGYADVVRPIRINSNVSSAMVTVMNKDRKFQVFRKYYNYSLYQEYLIERDVTRLNFFLEYKSPKWYNKQLGLIDNSFVNSTSWVFPQVIFYHSTKDYLFAIDNTNPWGHNATLRMKRTGLDFIDSYQMIQTKERFQKMYKSFISAFKQMEAQDINSLIIQVPHSESIGILKDSFNLQGDEFSIEKVPILVNIHNLV